MTPRPIRALCFVASRSGSRSPSEEHGKGERNDRVFAVPDRSPFEAEMKDIRELPQRAVEEFEQFSARPMRSRKKDSISWADAAPRMRPSWSRSYQGNGTRRSPRGAVRGLARFGLAAQYDCSIGVKTSRLTAAISTAGAVVASQV
jgi:hypothetical protein